MVAIWEPQNRFSIWLEIELLALEAHAKLGKVPQEVVRTCRKKAKFDIARVDEIESKVKHDVIAFLTNVNENIGPESRYLHKGMTSSDVVDTCLAVQLNKASDLLLKDLDTLLLVLKRKAKEHKNTIRIGRSHGIHAEPTTFGLMLALYYDEFRRARERLMFAREQIAVGKISGAVGTFANIDPLVETFVCEKLGLKPAAISTQIVQRDNHAFFFSTLAVIAASVEKLATEIRHLQRSEVGEAEEYFSPGQKGSSAMPHKRNPILSENLCGLARVVKGYAVTALDNVALWHERDISHSSAERIIAPDATVTLDFMLNRLTTVVDKLVVYPKRMKMNLEKSGGLFNSQRILIALTEKGCSREKAYTIVQRNAMRVWEKGLDFLTELTNDRDVAKFLSEKELHGLFDLKYHTKNVDAIFKRVFG